MTKTAPIASSASPEIDAGRLREMRQDRGLNQADLAELCDVTPQYISQLENGHRVRVSPALFVRLCDALGIAADNRRILRKQRSEVA